MEKSRKYGGKTTDGRSRTLRSDIRFDILSAVENTAERSSGIRPADIADFLANRGEASSSADTVLSRGDTVASWRVVAFLGRGLSAEVYRVIDNATGCESALKLLVADSPALAARFQAECLALKRFKLPFLPRFVADGEHDGRPYCVMEFLEPLDLPLTLGCVSKTVVGIARAVEGLHRAGFVHRDLKPGNILLRRDGTPVLADLGLAKRIGAAARVSAVSSVSQVSGRPMGVGTVDFAAPEQLIKGVSSVESDVFSLGKILAAALPENGGGRWREVIRTATRDNPLDRYRSAAEFAAAVRAAGRRPRVQFLAASLLFVLLLAGGFAVYRFFVPAPDPLVRLAEDSDASYFARIRPLAGRGDPVACDRVAEAYYYGRGVETNRFEAAEWYRRGAEGGNADAQASYARCLLWGAGCEKNPSAAVGWYRRAAEAGNIYACDGLAFCYLNGIGVERDDKAGFSWAWKAAAQGYPSSECMVGECFLCGMGGVRPDVEKAVFWLQSAVRHGNVRAKGVLARLLE